MSQLKGYHIGGRCIPVVVLSVEGDSATIRPARMDEPHDVQRVATAELVDLPCRPCDGCDGFHHWLETYLDPDDDDDANHPALQDPEIAEDRLILSCKHCDAWKPIEDDEEIECWCGARGTSEELFDRGVFRGTCGGMGFLQCECGGDFCICHHHGEVECPGCDDCLADDFEDDGFELEDYDDEC